MSDKDLYLEFDEENDNIVLPSSNLRTSELTKKTNVSHKKNKYNKKNYDFNSNDIHNKKYLQKKFTKSHGKLYKWSLILIIIIMLYFYYNQALTFLMDILKSNPKLYELYLFIEAEIARNTLRGLFFVSILGSLFFLTLPAEALFIYFLNATDYNFVIIILIMLSGSIIGLIFNYSFGWLLGERIIKFMFRKNFEKYKEKIDKWGGLVLFFGNIVPGPIELLTVFYGAFKFNFTRFAYLCMMGRLIKFIIIFILFYFYWDQFIFFYEQIISEFSFLSNLFL